MASREMYDVLERLKELDKKNPNVINDAVDNTEKMNPPVEEGKAKPDFLDLDKDGNKKEPMKKAAKDKKEKVKTINVGKGLNSALARRVEELQKFRSDFFGRVRELIKGRKEIRIVGDRFVFQSEVLFGLGSDELGTAGKIEMKKLATTLMEIEKSLPTDIDWILQIEGHTDSLPVKRGQSYADNCELATKRALSVLRFLIKEGINPQKLSASGFGSYQPIDTKNTDEARMKNRRIEMKITQSTISK